MNQDARATAAPKNVTLEGLSIPVGMTFSANKVKNKGHERSVVLVVSLSNDRVPLEFTIHVSQDCSLRRHIGLRFCSHMRTQFRRSFCNGAKFGRANLLKNCLDRHRSDRFLYYCLAQRDLVVFWLCWLTNGELKTSFYLKCYN